MTAQRDAATIAMRMLGGVVLLALIGIAVLRSSLGTALDAFTVDEPWHVVAGATYARSGDFALNPEHPPLMKRWVGAWMPADFIVRAPAPLREKAQERDWVEQTMFTDNDPVRAQAFARAGMWRLHALLLAVLGLLIWRAGGWWWAAGSLAFLALEPTVGAHLPVAMTDLPLALTLASAAVAAGLLAAGWQWRWVAACGVAFGLALGAKHSALPGLLGLLAVLVVAAALGWREGRGREVLLRLCRLLVVAMLAIAVLWAQYDFRFHADANGSDAFNRAMAEKIAELKIPMWREGIGFADQWHLLPRAYLWGLADTVRTGVEGRGISEHFVWGTLYTGAAPWFAWPAIVLAKVPLALLALALLGALLLWRADLPLRTRWMLVAVLGASTVHLVALAGTGAIWGGVRHALPVLAGLSIFGGAAFAIAARRRSKAAMAGAVLLLVAAAATTLREPRLWEYHNELVGGSANAYRYFGNEGLDLGQRFAEIRRFHDREIAPSGLPMFSDYWMGEVQIRAAGLRYRRRVETLEDDNVAGVYEGYFVYGMRDTLAWPAWEWDPAEVFRELTLVQRFGNVGIWKGRQTRPRARAGSLYSKVEDYVYRENGRDWALVARRLAEVQPMMPQAVNVAIELGNAYLRLGDGRSAVAAYRRPLAQDKVPVDALVRRQLEKQIALVESTPEPAALAPMRNPWLE